MSWNHLNSTAEAIASGVVDSFIAQIRQLSQFHCLSLLLRFTPSSILHQKHSLFFGDGTRGVDSHYLAFEGPLEQLTAILAIKLRAWEALLVQHICGRFLL